MSFVFAANIVSLSPVLASSVPSPKAVVVGCAVVDDGAFLIDVASNKLNAFCSEGLCVLCAPGKSFTKRNRIVRQIKTVVLSHIFCLYATLDLFSADSLRFDIYSYNYFCYAACHLFWFASILGYKLFCVGFMSCTCGWRVKSSEWGAKQKLDVSYLPTHFAVSLSLLHAMPGPGKARAREIYFTF